MTALARATRNVVSLRAAPQIGAQPRGVVADFMSYFGGRRAGKWVDRDTAMTIGAFWSGANIIADLVSSLPVDTFAKTAAGARRAVELESEAFIWRRPNPEVTRAAFWGTVALQYVVHNQAFLYARPVEATDPETRQKYRYPVELWPVDPQRVRSGRDDAGLRSYIIDGVTAAKHWSDGGEIVHIPGAGFDGESCPSTLRLMAQSLGIALAAEEFDASVLGNWASPTGGYLSTEQPLTAQQAYDVGKQWVQPDEDGNAKVGSAGAGGLRVLGRGTKWMSTSLSPNDVKLLETRQFRVSDIARWLRIPEWLLASHDKESSWGSGIAEQTRALLRFRIDPILIRFEQVVSDVLLARQNHYMKFNRNALLSMSPKEQADVLAIEKANGVINGDDWAALKDYDPIPDGIGRIYTVSANMVEVTKDGLKAPAKPDQAPVPVPAA